MKAIAATGVVMLIGMQLGGAFKEKHRIGLDLNDVRCLPWRVYYLTFSRGPFSKGQYVAFVARNGIMGQRFEGKLVGKQVAGVHGDHVVIKGDEIYINDQHVSTLYLRQKLGRPPGYFDRDLIIPENQLLLLGTEPHSYDGRYWGFISSQQILGVVDPIF